MQRIITILITIGFFLTGCMDTLDIVEPADQISQVPASRPYNVSGNWLSLPKPEKGKGMTTNSGAIYTQTEYIDGSGGGSIMVELKYTSNLGILIEYRAELKIKKSSFEGIKPVTFSLYPGYHEVLIPGVEELNEDSEFNLEIKGLNLEGLDPSAAEFVISDGKGNLQHPVYDKLEVKTNNGEIKLEKALMKNVKNFGFLLPMPRWMGIPLFEQISAEDGLFSQTMLINGAKGGRIEIEGKFLTPYGNTIEYKSDLKFHKGSFEGEKEITHTIHTFYSDAMFSPHVEKFDIPAEYSFEITGLDLSGLNKDEFTFVYQAPDGSYEVVEYGKLEVDVQKGKLKIDKAKLPHFSRFGFVN